MLGCLARCGASFRLLLLGAVFWIGAAPSGAAVWRVHVAKPRNQILDSVSCRSMRFCIAVGIVFPKGTTGVIRRAKPLAEIWNGLHWSIREDRRRQGPVTKLTGVSCTSTTAYASGRGLHEAPRSGPLGRAVEWVELVARRHASRAPGQHSSGGVVRDRTGVYGGWERPCPALGWDQVVACAYAATRAFPIGCVVRVRACVYGRGWQEIEQAVALRRNGTKWRITLTDNNDDNDDFDAVSCASLSFCIMAGDSEDGGGFGLWSRWNGARWSEAD